MSVRLPSLQCFAVNTLCVPVRSRHGRLQGTLFGTVDIQLMGGILHAFAGAVRCHICVPILAHRSRLFCQRDPKYAFTCCGKLEEWKISPM